jgi:hypothetical protein
MLHIRRQVSRGFFQLIDQGSNFWSARVRYQQSSDGQRGFLEFLELISQLHAIFAKLLQKFIVVDKVTI